MRIVWIVFLIVACFVIFFSSRPKPQVVIIHPKKYKARTNTLLVFLNRCKQEFMVYGNWISVVDMADVYRKGSFPRYRPNYEIAMELYTLALGCPDPSVSRMALLKHIECRDEVLAFEDHTGIEIPRTYAMDVIRAARMTIKETTPVSQPPIDIPVPRPVISSDAQNVHDHGVTRSMHAILHNIPASENDAYEKIVDYVLTSGASETVKSDALSVLDTLSNQTHSTLETSEREALNKVWSTIDAFETSKKSDARDVLLEQLASGVEDGAVVCSTGKIARILGTLDGLSDGPGIRPTWALREELGTMASKIRDANGDSEAFKNEAKKVYVDDLGMNPEIIDAIVDEYSVGFT